MERKIKRWRCCDDRLTSLPDELLGRVLSLLKTKDVAATQVLSKRMRRGALSLITSIDLDDSPLIISLDRTLLDQRFPLFKSFVTHVLRHSNHPLTRFRLHFGSRQEKHYLLYDQKRRNVFFPHVEPARLNEWISYPLPHYGLRVLDLYFRVRDPCHKLPPSLFASRSLEVLRFDSNLVVDDCAHIQHISLPNLKLLSLGSFVFTEDEFVTRLVSGCPVLEDLSIICSWKKSDHLIISSHSLRRLTLDIDKCDDEEKNSELVLIDTPNLEYLCFVDTLAFRYSLVMNAVVEATINILHVLQFDSFESSFRCVLDLIKPFSNVQCLYLTGRSPESIVLACWDGDALKDLLPVFQKLRTLKLDAFDVSRPDTLLLALLNCSPLLETLIFCEGLFHLCVHSSPTLDDMEAAALEADVWRTTDVPSCCITHLKHIEYGKCFGFERELNMIRFLLGNARVLKEYVTSLAGLSTRCTFFDASGARTQPKFDSPDLDEFERTLKELPRASNSCSITVRRSDK